MCAIMQEYEKKAEARGEVRGEARVMTKTAVNMLRDGFSIDLISKYSGLSFEQVMALKQHAAEPSESFA